MPSDAVRSDGAGAYHAAKEHGHHAAKAVLLFDQPAEEAEPVAVPDIPASWKRELAGEFAKPYWAELQEFVAKERDEYTVYPPEDEVYTAFKLTPYRRRARLPSRPGSLSGPGPGARTLFLGQAGRSAAGFACGTCTRN